MYTALYMYTSLYCSKFFCSIMIMLEQTLQKKRQVLYGRIVERLERVLLIRMVDAADLAELS